MNDKDKQFQKLGYVDFNEHKALVDRAFTLFEKMPYCEKRIELFTDLTSITPTKENVLYVVEAAEKFLEENTNE